MQLDQEQQGLVEKFGIREVDAAEPISTERPMVGVQVLTVCSVEVDLSPLRFEIPTKRGNLIHLHKFAYDKSTRHLSFVVSEEVGKDFMSSWSGVASATARLSTTFADFCFLLKDGTTPESFIEVDTKLPQGVALGDLTWCLPSKFADDLIEALHIANAVLLEGILEHAVLIGPYLEQGGLAWAKPGAGVAAIS